MTKPALHASALTMFSRCPVQFEWRYIKGVKAPPGVAMVIGKAVDLVGSDNALHKMAHGDGAAVEAVEEKASAFFESAWEGEEPMLSADEKERGRSSVKGESKDMSIKLARLEAAELLPTLNPVSVQRARRLVLEGFPFDIEGTTDLEEADTIDDRKCVGKSPSAGRASDDVQLDTYAMLAAHVDKKPKASVRIHSLVKNKTPKLVTVSAPARTDFNPLLRRIERVAQAAEAGIFVPADPKAIASPCNPAMCGWFDQCEFGRRARVTVSMSEE